MEALAAGDAAYEGLNSEQRLHHAVKLNDTATIRQLLLSKVNINARNSEGRTALHWATAKGHEDAVRILLEYNVLVDASDKFGMTPILLAADSGHLNLIQILVKAGAIVTAENRLKQGLVHCAAQHGYLDIICYAVEDLEGIPLDNPDESGKTPLLLAAENGHPAVWNYLCELGCDHQNTDKELNSALHLAVRGGRAELLGCLMEVVYSEAKNQEGYTPLHLAAQAGHHECVQGLLKNQCQINTLSIQNLNALHYSLRHGHEDVCRLLVQEGIDVNAVGNKDPCLHLAVKHSSQLVQVLIAAGCDVNICDHRRQSALHVAVERRQPEVVEQLLRAGVDLNLQDQQGRTALSLAVRSQHAALTDMIIKAERFYSNRPGVDGRTEGGEELDLSFSHVRDLTRVRSVLWTLATRHLKPGEWKKLAQHWNFSAKHVKALETQWTGSNSYKEHGYRLLLIWLHGVTSMGKHPIKGLYEGLVEIGSTGLAEKVRQQANAEAEPAKRCAVM